MATQNQRMQPFGSPESLHSGITQSASTIAANNRAAASRASNKRQQDMEFEKFIRMQNVRNGMNMATNADEAQEEAVAFEKAYVQGNSPVERPGVYMGEAYAQNQSLVRDLAVKQITDSAFLREAQAQRVVAENDVMSLSNPDNMNDLTARVLASAYGLQSEVNRKKFLANAVGQSAVAEAMRRQLGGVTGSGVTLNTEPGALDLGDNRGDVLGSFQYNDVPLGEAFRGIDSQAEANEHFRDIVDAANFQGNTYFEKGGKAITGAIRTITNLIPGVMAPMQEQTENLQYGGYMGPEVRARVKAIHQITQISQNTEKIARDLATKMGVTDDEDRIENISNIAGKFMGLVSRTFAARSRDADYVQQAIFRASEDDPKLGEGFANFMTRSTGINFDIEPGKETGLSYEDDYRDLRTQIEQLANVPQGAGEEYAEDVKLALQIVGNVGFFLGNAAAENVTNQGNFGGNTPEALAAREKSLKAIQGSTGYGYEQLERAHEMYAYAKLEEGEVYRNFGAAVNEVLGEHHISTAELQGAANELQGQLTPFRQLIENPDTLIDTNQAIELMLRAGNQVKSDFVPLLGDRGLLSGQLRGNAEASDELNPTRENLEKMRDKFLARAKTYYKEGRGGGNTTVPSLFHKDMTLPEQLMMIGAVNEVQERAATLGVIRGGEDAKAEQQILRDIAGGGIEIQERSD